MPSPGKNGHRHQERHPISSRPLSDGPDGATLTDRHGLDRPFRLRFLKEFLKHPRQVASIMPSSRFLERRIVDVAGVPQAATIVELGPGTGGTTRAILHAMRDDARLLSIEINPQLHACLNGIGDGRLIAHSGSAERLGEALETYGLGPPDAVISGIPFSAMDRPTATRIVEAVASSLAPEGCFVAYQASGRVAELTRPFFEQTHLETVLLNMPPVQVYRWTKLDAPCGQAAPLEPTSGRVPA